MNIKSRVKKIAHHPATHVVATDVTAVVVAKSFDAVMDKVADNGHESDEN